MTIIDLWNEIYFYRLNVDLPSRVESTAQLATEWEEFLASHGLADQPTYGSTQRFLDGQVHPRSLAEPDYAGVVELFVSSVQQALRDRGQEPPASFWRLSALLALSIADFWELCVSEVNLAAEGIDAETLPPGFPPFGECSVLRHHLQEAEEAVASSGGELPDSVYRLAAVSALSVARRGESWWSQIAYSTS